MLDIVSRKDDGVSSTARWASLIEYLSTVALPRRRILRVCGSGRLWGPRGPGAAAPAEELFLYPAECSTVTALPGVARRVHPRPVHRARQESGRPRPRARRAAKDLQTAQGILGIHGRPAPPRAPPLRRGPTPASRSPRLLASPALVLSTVGPAPWVSSPLPDELVAQVEAGNGRGPTPGAGPTEEAGAGPPGAPRPVRRGASCGGVEDTPPPSPPPSPDAKPPGARVREGGAPRPPTRWRRRSGCGGHPGGGLERAGTASRWLSSTDAGGAQQAAAGVRVVEAGTDAPRPAHRSPPLIHALAPTGCLRCLLTLVATEVNPKRLAPEQGSTRPVALKLPQEEQSGPSPPGEGPRPAIRSPLWAASPPPLRGPKPSCHAAADSNMFSNSPSLSAQGGATSPRSLLGAAPGGDHGGRGVRHPHHALPPNSSRHSRRFSPNKEGSWPSGSSWTSSA
ncbi:unnamed protein product [Boreogadus saida]